jgi:glutamate carboxypeptidase
MPIIPVSSFQQRLPDLLDSLKTMVEMESPTNEKELVNELGRWVSVELERLGLQVERLTQEKAGDHWLALWGSGSGGVLLLHHLDTVYPTGTIHTRPWAIEGELAFGPGALDMKGGIAVTLAALGALRRAGHPPNRPVRCLFTSDEETGSRTSRALVEAQARSHDLVLCLEPAMPDGALKTSRKGTGLFSVEVHGRAAHAGNDPQAGINAIVEMAHQIPEIQALASPAAGTTVSVGVIDGGTRSNVIPERCRVRVDVRVVAASEQGRVDAGFAALRPVLPGAVIEAHGGWNRPPMARTASIASAFEDARRLGASLGLQLTEGSAGGGSDANYVAALGVPVLDGLGPAGDGAHSTQEFVQIGSLAERAALWRR